MFIVFEGIDGSGKSTQAKLLHNALKENGYDSYLTFEPTDSLTGSIIRNIFNHRIQSDHHTIAALFAADRLDHILNETNGILKQLNNNRIVICDRYLYSSYAYHGAHVDMEWVIEMNRKAAELLKPDITFYIDVLPEISMERIKAERSNVELFETLTNLQNVYEKYHEAFEKMKDFIPVQILNGTKAVHELQDEIFNTVTTLLSAKKAL